MFVQNSMAKDSFVSEVVDEIFKSILETPKKQRRIRSGAFWKKFGFERRTKERVEVVKSALKARAITINLEDSLFGLEKRSEQIVLKITDSEQSLNSKSKVEFQNPPSVKHEEIGEPVFESVHKYEKIEARVKHLAEVSQSHFDIDIVFSVLFVAFFWNDTPSYELSPGVYGATRSNWTYHTAGAISQTCKILNLTCKFEALGKRDAIIETRDEAPVILLAAEWEWDYDDIFGAGKELDKLKTTCQKNATANAFLLIYCPISKYLNHLEKIAEFWVGETAAEEQAPTLFLHTVIFEEKGNSREFQRLKTVMIHPTGIVVWSDLSYE